MVFAFFFFFSNENHPAVPPVVAVCFGSSVHCVCMPGSPDRRSPGSGVVSKRVMRKENVAQSVL